MTTDAVLIAGASGFIGAALQTHLIERGLPVVSVGAGSSHLDNRTRCAALYRDFVDTLGNLTVGVVYHLVGSGIPKYPLRDRHRQFWANYRTTSVIAEALRDTKFKGRIVFASSGSVYGDTRRRPVGEDHPLNPCTNYGRSKANAEALLIARLAGQCELCIARLFHVFGPGQRKLVVYDIGRRILRNEGPLRVDGTGCELRDFVFVTDAVKALVFAGLHLPCSSMPQILNVSSGNGTTVADLARLLLGLANREGSEIIFNPPVEPNPIVGCIGENTKLSTLGMRVPLASSYNFEETLSWIRSDMLNLS